MRSLILAVLAAMMCGLVAITSQSLWIDEANSAMKAMQPSFSSFVSTFATAMGSDLQMPLYMVYLWAWEKLAGHSEFALRLANLPWFLLAQLTFYLGLQRRHRAVAITAFCLGLVHPFLWAYLDEARPYIIQYAGSCLATVALFRLSESCAGDNSNADLWLCAGGGLVLGGSSLLGMPFAGMALLVALIYLAPALRRSGLRLGVLTPLLVMVAGLAVLSVFYLWTLRQGAGASGGLGGTGLANLLFAAYELLGLSGLGPGRIDLRANGLHALIPHLVTLLPGVAVLAWAAVAIVRRSYEKPKLVDVLAALLFLGIPVLFILGLGLTRDFRVLGRHFMPFLPAIILGAAFALSSPRRTLPLWQPRILLAIFWLISALTFSFAPRHRKDDYRSAAAFAEQALSAGKTVCWAACAEGAAYYGVSFSDNQPGAGKVCSAGPMLRSENGPDPSRPHWVPDVIILSKPDVYDPSGEVRKFIDKEGYRRTGGAQAFTFWER